MNVCKLWPCPFCGAEVAKLPRHMRVLHPREPKIIEILEKSKTMQGKELEKYKRYEYKLLGLEGARRHSAAVVYQKKDVNDTSKSMECPDCGWCFRDVKAHKCVKAVTVKLIKPVKKPTAISILAGKEKLDELLSSMSQDTVLEVASRDDLIKTYATFELLKISDDDSELYEDDAVVLPQHAVVNRKAIGQKDMIRKHIRLLARYVITFRKKYPEVNLADTFTSEYIHYTRRTIRKMTGSYRMVAKAKKLIFVIRKLYRFAKSWIKTPSFKFAEESALNLQFDKVNSHLRKRAQPSKESEVLSS